MSNRIFNQQEEKILNHSQSIKWLKNRRILYFLFIFLFIYNITQNIYNLTLYYQNKPLFISFAIFLIIDIILLIYFIKRFILYNTLLNKYEKINDEKTNPLVIICHEKINNCKLLLLKKENYYIVKNSYMDLKIFLEKNKDLLPVITYTNAQKELKYIGDEMINCDTKK